MKQILNRIFPENITNIYTGHKIALYLFYALTAFTLWRSQHHLFSADGGAHSIATIPLDTFTELGAAAVIGVFGLWGLSQLIIGILYLIVSLRYKAMIPLMYLLMIIEYGMRILLGALKPIETVATAPGAIGNFIILPLAAAMLVISLRDSEGKEPETL